MLESGTVTVGDLVRTYAQEISEQLNPGRLDKILKALNNAKTLEDYLMLGARGKDEKMAKVGVRMQANKVAQMMRRI